MKHIYALFILAVGALVLFQSCNKRHDHATKLVTIDTALAAGSTYQLALQPYGDHDDSATIVKQASNFLTSAVTNPAEDFASVYTYTALADSKILADQVVLAVVEGNGSHGNCDHHGDSTLITINFTYK
jgi:hypothetical protein